MKQKNILFLSIIVLVGYLHTQEFDEMAQRMPKAIESVKIFEQIALPANLPRFKKANVAPLAGLLTTKEKVIWNSKVEQIESIIDFLQQIPDNVRRLDTLAQELVDIYYAAIPSYRREYEIKRSETFKEPTRKFSAINYAREWDNILNSISETIESGKSLEYVTFPARLTRFVQGNKILHPIRLTNEEQREWNRNVNEIHSIYLMLNRIPDALKSITNLIKDLKNMYDQAKMVSIRTRLRDELKKKIR
jgi:hypothetical protein